MSNIWYYLGNANILEVIDIIANSSCALPYKFSVLLHRFLTCTAAMAVEREGGTEWTPPPSLRNRSCLNISTTEPCVNKAVSHLSTLKRRLSEQRKLYENERGKKSQLRTSFSDVHQADDQRSSASAGGDSRIATPKFVLAQISETADSRSVIPKPILQNRNQEERKSISGGAVGTVTPHSAFGHQNVGVNLRRDSDLRIDGSPTGTSVVRKSGRKTQEKRKNLQGDWLDASDIIEGAVHLVERLEEDRQETLRSLAGEEVRVRQLRKDLDAEAEKRLDLLPCVVQAGRLVASPCYNVCESILVDSCRTGCFSFSLSLSLSLLEHEECLRDVLELKWHVSFEGRQLARMKDNLRVICEYLKITEEATERITE